MWQHSEIIEYLQNDIFKYYNDIEDKFRCFPRAGIKHKICVNTHYIVTQYDIIIDHFQPSPILGSVTLPVSSLKI